MVTVGETEIEPPVCVGEVFQVVTLPTGQPVAVSVTLVPEQVLSAVDDSIGGSKGFTLMTKPLLVTVHGDAVHVKV